jgi:hypothetical protein
MLGVKMECVMFEKCKVMLSKMIFDAQIDVQYQIEQELEKFPDLRAYMAKYPKWGSDNLGIVVEGSVTYPQEDEARLLPPANDGILEVS